jgi:hypothetical protein
MSRIPAQRPPTSTTGRYTADGLKKAEKHLHSLEAKLTRAKAALHKQQTLMKTARFTPAGYQVAFAKLQALQQDVKVAKKDRDDFKKKMMMS